MTDISMNEGHTAELPQEVKEVLWQYEADLAYPPSADSRRRRLEWVSGIITKFAATGTPS